MIVEHSDSERLDWLINNMGIEFNPIIDNYSVIGWEVWRGGKVFSGETRREVIDQMIHYNL